MASEPGFDATALTLGSSFFTNWNAGSMFSSLPPFRRAISAIHADISVLPMPARPTRPLNSGLSRSFQLLGGVLILSVL